MFIIFRTLSTVITENNRTSFLIEVHIKLFGLKKRKYFGTYQLIKKIIVLIVEIKQLMHNKGRSKIKYISIAATVINKFLSNYTKQI